MNAGIVVRGSKYFCVFCCVTAVEKSVRESAQLHVQCMVQRVFRNQ